MNSIIAIDPGSSESAFVLMDRRTYHAEEFGKVPNEELRDYLRKIRHKTADMAVEMIASYGMPVGREVFDTCVWIGRFLEQWEKGMGGQADLVYRKDEKLTICGSPRANDATIRQALVDRFAPGTGNYGKGTKKEPGWFYGFRADIWQAYAVGVTWLDMRKE